MSRPATGRVVELALDVEPLRPPEVGPDEIVYIVLRRRGRVVGRLVADGRRGLKGEALLAEARDAAAAGIAAADAEDRLMRPATAVAPAQVSVVIATRNRPNDLRSCLSSLSALDPGPAEIVVSDSASDDPASVAAAAREAGARLVRCDRKGLSRARNAGAAAAGGAILAFLDDDCRVDSGWLAGIVRGFEDGGVDAVTGSFAPTELATDAQLLFLDYSHMDRRGATAHRFSRERAESKHWPLDVWRVGSGGNLAVRAGAFRARGGFRPDLGLGTSALGGEDLYFLWSTIGAGRDVVYRFDAMVRHRHHRSLDALRRVMFGYGAGHAAYLRAARSTGAPRARVAFYAASVWYDRAKRLAAALAAFRATRAGLVLREAAGMIASPGSSHRARGEEA